MSLVESPKIISVVGAQWGDESKGHAVEYFVYHSPRLFGRKIKLVGRGTGGSNTGRTVVNEKGKTILHTIPAAPFTPDVDLVSGPGELIDAEGLIKEADELKSKGASLERYFIDNRCVIIFKYHKVLDALEELAKGGSKVGTTGRGIGPAMEDRMARVALRAVDLIDSERALYKLSETLDYKKSMMNLSFLTPEQQSAFDVANYADLLGEFAIRFASHIVDTGEIVERHLDDDQAAILCEGSQGSLLDFKGSYPYSTASDVNIEALYNGMGLAPRKKDVQLRVGVFKPYITRVGAGPFPTEMDGEDQETGDRIRVRGGEYGATTGRDRRIGWMDYVAARYAQRLNRFDSIFLAKMDVFSGQGSIKACIGYEIDGEEIEKSIPVSWEKWVRVHPIYEVHNGWEEDISNIRDRKGLPLATGSLVNDFEINVGVPVDYIGVGPARDSVIERI